MPKPGQPAPACLGAASARLGAALAFLGAALAWAPPPAGAQEPGPVPEAPALEIPEDLRPEGANLPRAPQAGGVDHYDENGYPEDARGLLAVYPQGPEWLLRLRGEAEPYLLYAQFANRQRDAVLLARGGPLLDPLPDGSLHQVPRGLGALRSNETFISVVESLLLPHLSDNQKSYRLFPLRDLYLGTSLGLAGLLVEARYVHRETWFAYAAAGANPLAGARAPALAPLPWFAVPLRLGAGTQLPSLASLLPGDERWSLGAELLLGFGDADRDPDTPAAVWLPGVFLELEKRDLFGWGSRWAGLGARGDFREDPRPDNYHVRALFLRLGLYLDPASGGEGGWLKLGADLGFRYNLLGPRLPRQAFKQTRVLYLHDEYREELLRQRERRLRRDGGGSGG